MTMPRLLACAAACLIAAAVRAAPVTDEASAIAEAKRYTRAHCGAETPCAFRPRREGSRWNVWVEFTRRDAPGGKPHPYAGGYVILYFDTQGRLVKRIQGQ
jgi:hypothetical protein